MCVQTLLLSSDMRTEPGLSSFGFRACVERSLRHRTLVTVPLYPGCNPRGLGLAVRPLRGRGFSLTGAIVIDERHTLSSVGLAHPQSCCPWHPRHRENPKRCPFLKLEIVDLDRMVTFVEERDVADIMQEQLNNGADISSYEPLWCTIFLDA